MNSAVFVSAVSIPSQCVYPFANTANSVTVLMRPTTAHGLLSIQITLCVVTLSKTDHMIRRSDRVSHESTLEVIH